MMNKKNIRLLLLMAIMMLITAVCSAESIYPETLDNGNLVLVDAHMGVGTYADRSSVTAQKYAPPDYQIAINVISVQFSEAYWRKHHNYLNSPYVMGEPFTMCFRYNWNRKSVAYQTGKGSWRDWNINRDNCHADGDPLIALTAETAFVSAYNMHFYGNTMGDSPVLKKHHRGIEDNFIECCIYRDEVKVDYR